MSYKSFYQRFLQANAGVQHFACHSHHYWPDVTRDAALAYWDDSARMVDDKWDYVFGEKVPKVQRQIAQLLKLQAPEQIVFAPNTHELLFRLLSCFDLQQPLKVLSSDSEFHSFSRQIKRFAELPNVEVVQVATEPFATFEQRFVQAAQQLQPDLVFCSQVFFNSGVAIPDLTAFVAAIQQVTNATTATIAIDGYHGFMALPSDLSALEGKIFYLAGSYKYAQGGEGCCFMVVPQHNNMRPLYTGWFAEFGTLAQAKTAEVQYSQDGYQFAGATMDFTALYRLEAVLDLYQQQQITIDAVHQHVQQLQQAFLVELEQQQHPLLNRTALLAKDLQQHGHFLTFKLPSTQQVADLAAYLKQHKIYTDYRGDRLRFGFAPYQDVADIDLSCLQAHRG
ncbi:aminotransferase class V-fold PLP-dependent enzyme [Rheinheimera riviphila]|uniref:Aminotransferase class V-fold PLP-dependent enzyme n=1 Tax=Rheinheimera riviphila TaxID=1834037 RepID=A0A437QFL3_9GAMM|nr:aminotransferase class V-fold PLP-dependent enzyme [Rheinheimera riviphila]RVU33213.1 aminotransferase class V-fold PLP-dependent enzyme [Rheinheimera riviphila]